MIRSLEYFWCQRDNFHELLGTKFTSYRPKNTRTDRLLAVIVQNNACITIEANDRTVRATNTLLGAHHYRLQHITFFDLTTRNCFFDGDLDDVAYACVATVRATQNLDTHYATCTGVVGDVQHSLFLDHFSAPLMSTTTETRKLGSLKSPISRARHYNTTNQIWVEKINGSSLSRLSVSRMRTLLQNRFLYNANQRPGLSLGQRTAFADFNLVADTAFVVLVMYVQFGRTFDEFTVNRVFHHTFDSNNNGFLHFVANYATLQSTDFIGHYAPAF
ncbi:Hypothetical protein B819_251947 [Klebsiella pneumoniae subsp. pneumoniae KpQ3]|nr:Hypothetical protein B819_251947 [Klebsiella pneumoniae subsp. pneumoniae KpQ3]